MIGSPLACMIDESVLNDAMDRYACGDARSFPELHRALYPRLLAYLTRMCGSATLGSDLTQETFLRMHRARSTFSKGAAVLPWAYAVARNVHIDHARAAKHRGTERLPSDPGAEPADERGHTAEALAIASETARAVERVLAHLPAAQREAFILLRYEGLSVQDAAAILGATTTAVKLRAFRAYEALRAELNELRRPEGDAEPRGGLRDASTGENASRDGTKPDKGRTRSNRHEDASGAGPDGAR